MEIGREFGLKSESTAKNTKCGIDENSKSSGNRKIRYILDSSAFFLLNKFAMAKEKSIDDIVHGDIFIDESISVLCEAIESRLCYVTQKTYEEIERAEASGRISAGVTKWVYDNFFTLNYKVSPERYESLMSIEDVEDGKTYKAKYFNLVWSAIRLMASLECQVVIVSTSKRFVNLALANKVLVKDLTELDTL